MVGVDLFAGAGGMALGARWAGVDVRLAIESDPHAAATYKKNHPDTEIIVEDIRKVKTIDIGSNGKDRVLFGGPPCQGFSVSNQRTRNLNNTQNWLFKEFLRLVDNWQPEWVVFENVKGILETNKGIFLNWILDGLVALNYNVTYWVLNAVDFGVPQRRNRLFVIGSKYSKLPVCPKKTIRKERTVSDAFSDLPPLSNGANTNWLPYKCPAKSSYAKIMRNGNAGCYNHLVTKNAAYILNRYKYIPQGGNWKDIPAKLMNNYKDASKCHTGIYRRLKMEEPSIVICNYRKNMLIHPMQDRGLSVREAARLQSFPDWYEFLGSIGFQQQQVSNAVPPLLARAVFSLMSNERRLEAER